MSLNVRDSSSRNEHRLAADRSSLRYSSDLTDAEWAIVEPMIPPARHGGHREHFSSRRFDPKDQRARPGARNGILSALSISYTSLTQR
jgi:hypothetical protein